MKNVSTIALLALSKAIASEIKNREDPEVGTHKVSEKLTFEVEGSVQKCEDETYTPTVDIPLKVTLALFVRYSGITGDAALNALERAMSEALALGEKGEKKVSEVAEIDRAMSKVVSMLGELPRKTRKGKTNVKAKAIGEVANGNSSEAEAAE